MKKITFSLLLILISAIGFAQTFTGSTGAIPDSNCDATNQFPVTVTGVGILNTTNVLDQIDLDITHTWDADLDISLIAPDATVIDLTSDNGGSGDDFTGTQFRDDASTPITDGSPPFTGVFQPEQALGTFNAAGVDADGVWILQVCDDAGGDTGTLNSWSITFAPAPSCLAAAGGLTADASPVELIGGTATISATASGGIFVPPGFTTLFVLTSGAGLVIEQTAATPSFDVTAVGLYTIHTLVYDPLTLDPGSLPSGATGFDVNDLLEQGGGSICGALDVAGAPIEVGEAPSNNDCANATVLTPGSDFTANPVVGTNAFASASGELPDPSCSSYDPVDPSGFGGDVWYAVTVPADGNLTIETNANPTGSGGDSGMSVYSGSCGSLVEVGCDDDGSLDGAYSLVEITAADGLANQVVYARVFEYGGNSLMNFQISAYSATLSTDDFDNPSAFTYYPNPVKNTLTLNAQNNIENVRMYNMLGQEVLRANPNSLDSDIDMSNLANGSYFVKVTIANVTETIRVIKQ